MISQFSDGGHFLNQRARGWGWGEPKQNMAVCQVGQSSGEMKTGKMRQLEFVVLCMERQVLCREGAPAICLRVNLGEP